MWWDELPEWKWMAAGGAAFGGAFFTWVVKRLLDKGWDGFWKRRKRKQLVEGEQIGAPTDTGRPAFVSHFGRTPHELETVLQLRRAFFGDKVIVPDTAYRHCHARNLDAMRIVYYHGAPVGYWSVIPIARESFACYTRGECTHADMLTDHSLDWSQVDPEAVYLYIVGAVVPVQNTLQDVRQSLLQQYISGRVILDMLAFGVELFDRLSVRGVCGFASRTGGLRLFQKIDGFERLAINMEGKDEQPIFIIPEARVAQFRQGLRSRVKRASHKIPRWEPHDRRRFQDMLAKLTARRPTGSNPALTPPPTSA